MKNGSYELESIKNNLNNCSESLHNIANSLQNDFEGVGCEVCAGKVREMANLLGDIKKYLDEMDTERVTDQFKAQHPELFL